MLKKIAKLAAGAAILGGGLALTDVLYYNLVYKNLPDNFTNWIAGSATRIRVHQYGVSAAGTMVLLPLVAGMIGLGAKSPLKADASPLKS